MGKRGYQSWNFNGKKQGNFNGKNQLLRLSQGNSLIWVSRHLTSLSSLQPTSTFLILNSNSASARQIWLPFPSLYNLLLWKTELEEAETQKGEIIYPDHILVQGSFSSITLLFLTHKPLSYAFLNTPNLAFSFLPKPVFKPFKYLWKFIFSKKLDLSGLHRNHPIYSKIVFLLQL